MNGNRYRRAVVVMLLGALAGLSLIPSRALAEPSPVTLETAVISVASVAVDGTPEDGGWPSMSADGRFVAFQSRASNLVAGDTNGVVDVFVRNAEGETVRASVSTSGGEANDLSLDPAISADGRYVAFESSASNLVLGDSGRHWDVFVHDLQTRVTTRVSVSSLGAEANAPSLDPAISADGRYVTFSSDATTLVPGDITSPSQVYVHDRDADGNGVFDEPGGISTTRVSVSSNGARGNGGSSDPALSADGRYVAFLSSASNFAAGDTKATKDTFVHDRATGTTEHVSVSSDGTPADRGAPHLTGPSISADGSKVVFPSDATNLVPDDTNGVDDVFVRDRIAGTTTRVSVASDGSEGPHKSWAGVISGNGATVAFLTASSFVPGDTNGFTDVYVRDLVRDHTLIQSVSGEGYLADWPAEGPFLALSADGTTLAFRSRASNLGPDGTGRGGGSWWDRVANVFIRERDPLPSLSVDVKPSQVKPDSAGSVPVAILSAGRIDATALDPATICFGDADAPSERDCTEAHGEAHVEDVDGDGDQDLLMHYEVVETGIDRGDTSACLTGRLSGTALEGCDTIRTD